MSAEHFRVSQYTMYILRCLVWYVRGRDRQCVGRFFLPWLNSPPYHMHHVRVIDVWR